VRLPSLVSTRGLLRYRQVLSYLLSLAAAIGASGRLRAWNQGIEGREQGRLTLHMSGLQTTTMFYVVQATIPLPHTLATIGLRT
jgi:hypothetical protein